MSATCLLKLSKMYIFIYCKYLVDPSFSIDFPHLWLLCCHLQCACFAISLMEVFTSSFSPQAAPHYFVIHLTGWFQLFV